MKAIIEQKDDGLYLVRIYGSDGFLCDAYVVEEVKFKVDPEAEIQK